MKKSIIQLKLSLVICNCQGFKLFTGTNYTQALLNGLVKTRSHTQRRTHTHPPWRFLYLRETKSLRYEEREEGGGDQTFHLKTHDTARVVGVCPTEALAFMLGVTNSSVGPGNPSESSILTLNLYIS